MRDKDHILLEQAYESVREAKDYDKDGKVESPEDEYKGSKDKAIKKAKVEEQTSTKTNEEFVKWIKGKYGDKWKFVTLKDKHIDEFEQTEGPLDDAARETIKSVAGKKLSQIIKKPKALPYDYEGDREYERWKDEGGRSRFYHNRRYNYWRDDY